MRSLLLASVLLLAHARRNTNTTCGLVRVRVHLCQHKYAAAFAALNPNA